MPINNFDYSISWSDFTFQASRPQGEEADAFTKVHIQFKYNYARRGNGIVVTDANIGILMINSQCWVVTGRTTNKLLLHEQGHYDITALGGREFYTILLNLSARSVSELKTMISTAHTRCQQKIDRANIRYDNQTKNSQNTQMQHQWNQRVAVEKQKPNGSIDNLPQ